jgi:hypothetical protein
MLTTFWKKKSKTNLKSKNNTDVILANGKLQMRILELEENVKTLENKLSYTY